MSKLSISNLLLAGLTFTGSAFAEPTIVPMTAQEILDENISAEYVMLEDALPAANSFYEASGNVNPKGQAINEAASRNEIVPASLISGVIKKDENSSTIFHGSLEFNDRFIGGAHVSPDSLRTGVVAEDGSVQFKEVELLWNKDRALEEPGSTTSFVIYLEGKRRAVPGSITLVNTVMRDSRDFDTLVNKKTQDVFDSVVARIHPMDEFKRYPLCVSIKNDITANLIVTGVTLESRTIKFIVENRKKPSLIASERTARDVRDLMVHHADRTIKLTIDGISKLQVLSDISTGVSSNGEKLDDILVDTKIIIGNTEATSEATSVIAKKLGISMGDTEEALLSSSSIDRAGE